MILRHSGSVNAFRVCVVTLPNAATDTPWRHPRGCDSCRLQAAKQAVPVQMGRGRPLPLAVDQSAAVQARSSLHGPRWILQGALRLLGQLAPAKPASAGVGLRLPHRIRF